MVRAGQSPIPLSTIGHSTRPISEFVEILAAFSIQRLIDVRTVRRSRHNPQFNEELLAPSVGPFGIAYETAPELGGLRKPRKESRNLGWRNLSFRGYADYMGTEEFGRALTKLIERSQSASTAIMCAEAVPWRCHRSLIADALLLHGVDVRHLMGPTSAVAHRLTPFAVVRDGRVSYPADPAVATLDDFRPEDSQAANQ